MFSPVPVPVQGQGGIDTSKWYRLIAKHRGKCLDMRFANLVDGELLMQNTCHSGDNQKFQFESVGSGFYRIHTGHSHRCIDQIGAVSTLGGSVGQYQCHSGQNQQWLPSTSGSHYSFNVRHSSLNLDVQGGSTANFALLIQYTPHGGDNQLFTLQETTAPCTESGDNDNDGGATRLIAMTTTQTLFPARLLSARWARIATAMAWTTMKNVFPNVAS